MKNLNPKIKKAKKLIPTKAQKRKWWKLLFVILLISLALELNIHQHASFGIDGTRFFYAWFGFASCLAIIIVSKSLGPLLHRPENYYKGDDQ